MTDKMRVVAKNMIDDSRCVLSTAATEINPLDNLKNTIRGDVMQIASASAFSIKGTYGGDAIGVHMMSFLRNNLTCDSLAEFEIFSDAAWVTQTWTSTPLQLIPAVPLGSLFFGVDPLGVDIYRTFYGQKTATIWLPSRMAAKSWRLTITDTGNPDGFIEASRMWVGDDVFSLTYNPKYGMRLAWKEQTLVWETDGGSQGADGGESYRTLTFDLENIPEADRQRWLDILRYCGQRRDVFVSPYPEGTDEQIRDFTINGTIQGPLPELVSVFQGRDTTNMTIREV